MESESYLVDQNVLGQMVDALISEKYPGDPAEKYKNLRAEAIKALDHQILKSILGSLTKEQGSELSKLLDKKDSDPATFANFFEKNHVNLEEVMARTMLKFKADFLKGGSNV
ncbi:MAG: DUF5663 domain-containing protein [Candidatus Saccharibacteria bacterium]|nr:DUF5663 domain-containing protein [Candidatus Saccharibacteria bacterium]